MSSLRGWFLYALQPGTVYRSLRVAALVGTLLTLINHYPQWYGSGPAEVSPLQLFLTYLVPYLVSTDGQVSAARRDTAR